TSKSLLYKYANEDMLLGSWFIVSTLITLEWELVLYSQYKLLQSRLDNFVLGRPAVHSQMCWGYFIIYKTTWTNVENATNTTFSIPISSLRSNKVNKLTNPKRNNTFMESLIKNFLINTSIITASLTYSYYIPSKLPKGIYRFISLIPILIIFTLLPLRCTAVFTTAVTFSFITWLTNFKLIRFAFDLDQSPYNPSYSLLKFIIITSLPIKSISNDPSSKQYAESRFSRNLRYSNICYQCYNTSFDRIRTRAVFKSSILSHIFTKLLEQMEPHVSGLMHELFVYVLAREAPTWEMTWFFVIHGVCVVMEMIVKRVVVDGGSWRLPGVVGRVGTVAFVAVTGVWLFMTPLVKRRLDVKIFEEYILVVEFIKDKVFGH
nr:probable long-chain-alcohol O-fatty-acyltransferase 5 [Tanacetum cinerariifolium]